MAAPYDGGGGGGAGGMGGGGSNSNNLPRTISVKNKAPAPRQITAEQILREAQEIKLEDDFRPPASVIADPQELAEYRAAKRQAFEDQLRRVGRWSPAAWAKYAAWEEAQRDFRRARSVMERALEVDYRHVATWIKYAEMEMRHRFVAHARNVWDRAVTLLPRVDALWYRYAHMEEVLGNADGVRQVFERWMRFEPDHAAWMAYVNFELRQENPDRARAIFERYVEVLPSVRAWVRYAKFEMQGSRPAAARRVYERAAAAMGSAADTLEFLTKFAQFEEMARERDRARAIYRHGMATLPREQARELHEALSRFEKQHGDQRGVEDAVLAKRRLEYERAVESDPHDYDAWFDWVRLEEQAVGAAMAQAAAAAATAEEAGEAGLGGGAGAAGPAAAAAAAASAAASAAVQRARDTYERACAGALPPSSADKRYWRRYVYLWVKYALFEELDARDRDRAREVLRAALKLVPHASFTFAKLWLMAAKLELRAGRLDAARRVLGTALGMCPKPKLFKGYIELELAMGHVDRVRTLYEKYLEWAPSNADAWLAFAELEAALGEHERARALYELAVGQPVLDAPERVWRAYVEFECARRERARARVLYERLLDRTGHVKVWLSFARFELRPLLGEDEEVEGDEGEQEDKEQEEAAAAGGGSKGAAARKNKSDANDADDADDDDDESPTSAAACERRLARARAVYERGFRALREGSPDAKQEAAMLLEAWRAAELAAAAWGRAQADVDSAVAAVDAKRPRRVKRKRAAAEPGQPPEEYWDLAFPGEGEGGAALRLLEAAQRWKRQKQQQEQGEG